MNRRLWLPAALLLASCSARNCDNDALSAGFGGEGGAGSSSGGATGVGGMPGAGGAGGGGCDLCDGNCVELALDEDNCGVCGHVCQSGICRQGACLMDEAPMRVVSGIDVDQDGAGRFLVYTFAATSGTGYARIDPLGVTSQTLLSTTTVLADIRTTADSYFITDASVDYVYRVPKGAHSMVDPGWIDDLAAPGVTYLAHEGSYVCWAETDGIDCNLFGVPSDTIDLGPDSTPGGIDIEGQTLYATLRNLGILERASFLDLTSFTVVATGLPTPTFGVTVRGAEAFVATPAGLHRVTIATGEVSSIAAADIAGGGTMASTVSAVYLADLGPQGGDGRLWRFRLDGGDAEVLYQAPGQVRSLVIEDQYVFFTADTAVYRRALAAPSFSDVAPGGG